MSDDCWNKDVVLDFHDRVLSKTVIRFFPVWVHPNHVTIFRMVMTPFVAYVIVKGWYALGVPLFFVVAISDALDGTLARVRRQVTEWGITYDPVADKMFIGATLLILVVQQETFLFGIVLLAVECVLVLGGIWMKLRGRIQPANTCGKMKMVAEVTGIMFLLVAVWLKEDILFDFSVVFLFFAIVSAVMSSIISLKKR